MVVGTYRLMRDVDAARAGGFYTAGEYEIAPMLAGIPQGWRVLELGRSCVLKSYRAKPGSMQLLWRGVMTYVARFSIDLMFGCASLQGTDPDAIAMPLSYLHHFHAMPDGMHVRARPELYVDMNLMPKDGHRSEGSAACVAAADQGLCARGLRHRRRRRDRPAVRHDRRLHLFPRRDDRSALQKPLRHHGRLTEAEILWP